MSAFKIDLSGLGPERVPSKEIVPGSIVRSRQGRLYWVMGVPPSDDRWAGSQMMYYFTLDRYGNISRVGQVMYGYAVENWTVVGHCPVQIGEPVWFE